jgi:hypothetical protein
MTPRKKKLYISRHVTFFENESFFKNLEENQGEQINSSDFVLPCITNEERREVFVEKVTNETGEEEQDIEEAEEPTEVQVPKAEQNLRRSTRQTRASTRLKDFATYTVQYPIQDYISYKNISKEYCAFVNVISTMEEPATFEEAKRDSKWCKAMEEELHALKKKSNPDYMPSTKK